MNDFFQRIRFWFNAQPPAIRWLLIVNIAAYLAWQLVIAHIGPIRAFLTEWVMLHPETPGIFFRPWQLITYAFLHTGAGLGGFFHVLFNMLWLVWIGREYEQMQGSHRLLAIYVFGAVLGAVLSVALNAAFPGGPFRGPIVGASGAVYAVMAAVATFYPQKGIGLMFIGVVRISVILGVLLFLDILFIRGSSTAIGAHWGGALAGFLFARGEMRGMDLSGWAAGFFRTGGRGRGPARSPAADAGTLARIEAWLSRSEKKATPRHMRLVKDDDAPTGIDPDETINRLLDKISEEGYESLTEAEKKLLHEAAGRK